jgi:hypothetical protein
VAWLPHILRESPSDNKGHLLWQADCTGDWPKEERLMPIVKITGQGLSAIALSVALLWGCLMGERVAARRAFSERAKVLRDISRMKRRQRTQPVSAPSPFIPHRARVAAG